MILNELKSVLLDMRDVESVICRNNEIYFGRHYDCIAFCNLVVQGERVPVVIGVDSDWETDLFDFYIRNYEQFAFIPHVELTGKLCLFDLEGVLIDVDFAGLMQQCVLQAIKIISDGINETNKLDFIKEFNLYWLQLPDIKSVKFAAPEQKESGLVKFIWDTPQKKANESIQDYRKRKKASNIYASMTDYLSFNRWKITGSQRNGLYLFLESKDYIFPPDIRSQLSIGYINSLLALAAAEDEKIRAVVNKLSKQTIIIFELLQPDKSSLMIGAFCNNAKLVIKNNTLQLTDDTIINPLYVERNDRKFIQSRVADSANPLAGKSFLIIGCGSIGGYLGTYMAKAGCDDLTFVDNQTLAAENIYRHVLGMKFLGFYKADAMREYLFIEIPYLNVKSRDFGIQYLVRNGVIDFTKFDVIISATGNHNVNRWLNRYVQENSITVPVIYAWNEPLDIGCHAALFNQSWNGDYEKLFSRDLNTGTLFDKTAYCEQNQEFTRNLLGCGSSYIPYGNEVSIQTAMLALDLLKRLFTGRVNHNVVISCKGSGYFFMKAGLKCTYVYTNQKEPIVEIVL